MAPSFARDFSPAPGAKHLILFSPPFQSRRDEKKSRRDGNGEELVIPRTDDCAEEVNEHSRGYLQMTAE